MRGIISYGAYVPHRRLDRSTIAAVAGTGGGKGTRTVASYDEDTTTLGVEAARRALRATTARPGALWFSTVTPAYVDKTNATTVHAALLLPGDVIAADFGGAVRSGIAAYRSALAGGPAALVVTADIRTGLPGSADETAGGDAAAALLIGDEGDGSVIAELLGSGTATDEFLDRWRTPGDDRSKQWEEKFGEGKYVALGQAALRDALKDAGIEADRVDALIVAGTHGRANKAVAKKSGIDGAKVVDDLSATLGNPGAAQAGLVLAATLDQATPGQVIVVLSLADGADALVFKTTDAIEAFTPDSPIAEQAAAGAPVPYGKFLACPNFPTCRHTMALLTDIGVPCPTCGGRLLERISKKGRKFYGCENYPACDFVSWDKPTKMPCPQCGGMMVQKIGQNGSYIACMNKECGYIHRNAKKGKDEKEAEAE